MSERHPEHDASSVDAGHPLTPALDSAILVVGLGLPVWVFLIGPTWAIQSDPMPTWPVATADLPAGALFWGLFVQPATTPGSWALGARLLASVLTVW